jgi:hypothetical protein
MAVTVKKKIFCHLPKVFRFFMKELAKIVLVPWQENSLASAQGLAAYTAKISRQCDLFLNC